jgi:hypothetical protein
MHKLMPMERIENRIFFMRGQKVMIDRDLAELYGVPTKRLNEAVKRNSDRFPDEFMFQLSEREKSELVAICDRFRLLRHASSLPYAFNEQGVAMLSSVLNSKRAIQINILIIKTFVRLRRLISGHRELAHKVAELERGYSKHEIDLTTVFKVLKKLMERPSIEEKPKRRIGFLAD